MATIDSNWIYSLSVPFGGANPYFVYGYYPTVINTPTAGNPSSASVTQLNPNATVNFLW